MGHFQSTEDARKYFAADRFAATNGMNIDELSESECVCSMILRQEHRNAVGGIMGGVIFTLADFAIAVMANHKHSPTITLDANINFLSGGKGERLIARTSCVKEGKTVGVFQAEITDELGTKVALVTGTGYKISK